MKHETEVKKISIADDFSRYPAGRYRADGDASGTAFREGFLVPALQKFNKVEVIFDGVAGCGSSFLDEAFGGLVRENNMEKDFIKQHLSLSTSDRNLEDFVKLAYRYIDD